MSNNFELFLHLSIKSRSIVFSINHQPQQPHGTTQGTQKQTKFVTQKSSDRGITTVSTSIVNLSLLLVLKAAFALVDKRTSAHLQLLSSSIEKTYN